MFTCDADAPISETDCVLLSGDESLIGLFTIEDWFRDASRFELKFNEFGEV